MVVLAENISKRYTGQWVIRDFSYRFDAGNAYVILGSNGSGKSTLIQMLSGFLSPTSGKLSFTKTDKAVPSEEIHRHIALAAPWSELIEELSLRELIDFHRNFRKFRGDPDTAALVRISGLEHAADKQLRHYSSGMRQRVKLLLAITSDTGLLLLDEPTSNLDAQAVAWYNGLVALHKSDRIIAVASNHQEQEYAFCGHTIALHAQNS